MDNTEGIFAIDDRIVLGDGLFETIAVEESAPLHADLHWDRLAQSAGRLNIKWHLSLSEWMSQLNETIDKHNLSQGGLKVILSAGRAPRGLTVQSSAPTLAIQSFEYKKNTKPLRLMSASWKRDPNNPVYHVKSVNYLEAILAKRQAEASGVDDVLFYNMHHHATETTCANLFILHDGQLMTPPLSDGVLPGITRSRVMSWCKKQNISCLERSLTPSMIKTADALCVTNALQGVQSIQSLDEVAFPAVHPLIQKMQAAIT